MQQKIVLLSFWVFLDKTSRYNTSALSVLNAADIKSSNPCGLNWLVQKGNMITFFGFLNE